MSAVDSLSLSMSSRKRPRDDDYNNPLLIGKAEETNAGRKPRRRGTKNIQVQDSRSTEEEDSSTQIQEQQQQTYNHNYIKRESYGSRLSGSSVEEMSFSTATSSPPVMMNHNSNYVTSHPTASNSLTAHGRQQPEQQQQKSHNPPPAVGRTNAANLRGGNKPNDVRSYITGSTALGTSSAATAQYNHHQSQQQEQQQNDKQLLTSAQKRHNHVASEQKRRAAIRSGYDALCEAVPTLKAAVAEFETRLKRAKSGGKGRKGGAPNGDKNGNNDNSKKESASSVGGALTGGIQIGGEKIDGRAGPRSEAVVLGKSVEHVRDLLQRREELINELGSLQDLMVVHGINPNESSLSGRWNEPWDVEDEESLSKMGVDLAIADAGD